MNEKLSIGKRKLLEYLGEEYTTKIIDGGLCVYIDLGDYDIEIAGGYRSRDPFDIYVWRMKDRVEIVERYFKVRNDFPKVKALLDDIRERYGYGFPGSEPDLDSLRIIEEAITICHDGKPRTFWRWAKETYQKDGTVTGRFVDHMIDDDTFPKTTRGKTKVYDYLRSLHAGPWAMEAFGIMWTRYASEELKVK